MAALYRRLSESQPAQHAVEPAVNPNAVSEPDRPHHKIWPKRLPRELAVPETTLWFNLEVAATRFPNKAAYLFMGQPLGFGELKRQAEAIAGWLQRDAKIQSKPPAGLWGAPLLGITFGLGWAPCIGPTYSAVQLLSLSGGSSAAKGAFLAFVYSLGLGIPFLLIALAVRRGIGVMSFFRKHRLAIQRIGGGILVGLGLLMATGVWGTWVSELQYWFQTDVKLPI